MGYKTRISDRAAIKDDLNKIENRIEEIHKEQALPNCSYENYIKLKQELAALTCRRTSMRQRLTNVNRYWNNEQSYEPNITIAR